MSLAVLLFIPACSGPTKAPATIRIAVHTDPLSLDPHADNEVLTTAILVNIFDGLTGSDPDLRITPNLATRWENQDDLNWRFYLDPLARFHNGQPVEAEDVVFSLERARHHRRGSFASYLVEVESVHVVDRHAVDVRLRRPFRSLLNKLALVFIVPRGAPEEITRPVGSGPYRFVSYRHGERLRLEPAPNDWRQVKARHPVEFIPVENGVDRVDRLLDGRVDIAQDVPRSQFDRVRNSLDCGLVERPSLLVEYLHMRWGDPRFRDRRVRQAIDLAVDREALAENLFGDRAGTAGQLVAPGIFGYDPQSVPHRRDLARARQLLQAANHAKGLALTLDFRIGRQGELLTQQLRDIGLDVTTRSSDWGELFERLKRQEVDFYYGAVACPTADSSDLLDSFVHSRDLERGYGLTNFNGYANPELDRLVETAEASSDIIERRTLLQQAMRVLVNDLYVVPLIVPADVYGVREDIDWTPHLGRRLRGRDMFKRDTR